jgi:hypothetical protein
MPSRLDNVAADQGVEDGDGAGGWQSRVVTGRLIVSYTGSDTVENLQIEMAPVEPVVVDQETIKVESLAGGRRTPLIIPFRVRMKEHMLPSSMSLPVVATYLTTEGQPRSARWTIALPLCLVCTVMPPVKRAACKITFESNQSPPKLHDIFEDVVSQAGPDAAAGPDNVLSFQYYCGMDVTVLVSKSSNRYRLQSNDFHCIWLILAVLTKRLAQYFEGARGPDGAATADDFALSTAGPPLELYFAAIDQHLQARYHVKQLAQRLDVRLPSASISRSSRAAAGIAVVAPVAPRSSLTACECE